MIFIVVNTVIWMCTCAISEARCVQWNSPLSHLRGWNASERTAWLLSMLKWSCISMSVHECMHVVNFTCNVKSRLYFPSKWYFHWFVRCTILFFFCSLFHFLLFLFSFLRWVASAQPNIRTVHAVMPSH